MMAASPISLLINYILPSFIVICKANNFHSTNNEANGFQSVEADNDNEKQKATTAYQGKSSKRFSCGICFDSVKDSKMFTNPSCNHRFCTKCVSKYVKLKRKEKVVKLTCPEPECSSKLKPQQFQSILPKDLLVEWESAIYESSVSLKHKFYCPYENCSILMVNDGVKVVTSCECPSCHRLFCAQCKVPWHVDMNCRKFQKSTRDEKQLDKKFLELAKRKKWQQCPKCSMHVQRKGGCEHISCRCGCNFCYGCGKDWIHGHICNIRRS
ncbi:unnamed protein product [Vicia faba]|uniref:RBR-type E3 ubiquitin transferase n=1 Tax=Vicia faba TaxID=3906 RepID=A0AAV0ZJF5_VICFA|nr:unnamed protein product [Vicia faba]